MTVPERSIVFAITALALLALAITALTSARAADPPLPPGLDPGGTPIALITTGIDYTDPAISSRLARDGEGQLISWDFVDNDPTPYANDPAATALAKLLLETNHASRLIIVRVDPTNTIQLGQAAIFIERTPARIAAVPFASEVKQVWAPFLAVARRAKKTIYIVAASNATAPIGAYPLWPTAAQLKNAVSAAPVNEYARFAPQSEVDGTIAQVDAWVAPSGAMMSNSAAAGPPKTSAQAAVMLAAKAGCLSLALPDPHTANALRATLLARARPHPTEPKIKVHDPLCWQPISGSKN